MKTATGTTVISHAQLITGTDVQCIDARGGTNMPGQLAKPFPTVVKREK